MANIGTVEGAIIVKDLFSAEFRKLDAQIARAQSQLNALGGSMSNLGTKTKAAGSTFDKLGAHIKNTLIHVGTAVAAYKALSVAIDSVGREVEFERTLTKIANLTDTTRAEVAKFEQQLDSLRIASGRGPQELAAGFLSIASTGSNAVETTERLAAASKLAAIGLGDTNTIGRALSATINAYGRENINAAQAADQLLATVRLGGAEASEVAGVLGRVVGVANLMGISFAEVGASIATFTRLGVGADEAVTALRGTMMAMLNPSKGATDALAEMGMTMGDVRDMVKTQGLAATLIFLTETLKGNDEALADIIPNVRALAGVLANAGSQGEDYVENLRQIEQSSGDVATAMEDVRKSASFRWDSLKSQFESLAIALGEALLPGVEAVGKAFASLDKSELQDFGEAATRLMTGLAVIIKVVVESFDLLKAAAIALVSVKLAAALEAWRAGMVATAAASKTATASLTTFQIAASSIIGVLLLVNEAVKKYSDNATKAIDNIVEQSRRAGEAHNLLMRLRAGGNLTRDEQNAAREERGNLTRRINDLRTEIGNLERERQRALRFVSQASIDAKKEELATEEQRRRSLTKSIEISEEYGRVTDTVTGFVDLQNYAFDTNDRLIGLVNESTGQAAVAQEQLAGKVEKTTEEVLELVKAWDGLRDVDMSGGKGVTLVDKMGEETKVSAKEFTDKWESAWTRYSDYAFSAIDTTAGHLKGAIHEAVMEGSVSWEDMWDSLMSTLLDTFLGMLEQMVREWIIAQTTMAAVAKANSAKGGGGKDFLGGGGGGGGMGGGSIFSAMGSGAGGGATSAAGMAGWAAAFIAVVAILKNQSKSSGRLEADTVMNIGGAGGLSMNKDLSRYNSKEILSRYKKQIEAMEKMIENIIDFFDGLGGTINKLSEQSSTLTVGREGQGKNANWFVKYGKDLVKHFGDDAEAAFSFAMVQAIKAAPTIGLSSEVADAIKNSTAESMEELQDQIEVALTAVRARLGDVGGQIFDLFREWSDEIKVAAELGLAVDHLIAARDREFTAIRNQILGIDTSTADALAALASFQRGVEEVATSMQAAAQHNLAAAQQALADLLARGPASRTTQNHPFVGGTTTVTQSQADFEAEIAALRAQIERYIAELGKIPEALSEQEIDMAIFDALYRYVQGSRKYEEDRIKWAKLKVELEFAAIKAQLIALGKWEDFAELFNDAYAAAQEGAGKPGRGTGAGRGRRDARDDIRREVGGFGLSPIQVAIRDANQWFDDLAERIKNAGFSAAEAGRLIAEADAERDRRIEAAKGALVDKFRDFLGLITPFDKIKDTAGDLIKEIEDSPFGSERKGKMIARVLAEMNKQLDRMARQMAVGLLGQMIADMERFGATDAETAEARKQMALIEHYLKMEHYRTEIAILKAAGLLAPEVLAALEGAYNWLAGLDPARILGGGGGPGGGAGPPPQNGKYVGDEVVHNGRRWRWDGAKWVDVGAEGGDGTGGGGGSTEDPRIEAQRIRDSWRGLSGLRVVDELARLQKELAIVTKVFGSSAEILNEHAAAVRAVIDQFLEPVVAARRDLAFGANSIFDPLEQRDKLLTEAESLRTRFRSGDLSVVDKAGDVITQLLEVARSISPTGSEGYANMFREWDAFLAEIISTTPTKLGTAGNPMVIAGMVESNLLVTEQTNVLYRMERFMERSAQTLDSIDMHLQTGQVGQGVS